MTKLKLGPVGCNSSYGGNTRFAISCHSADGQWRFHRWVNLEIPFPGDDPAMRLRWDGPIFKNPANPPPRTSYKTIKLDANAKANAALFDHMVAGAPAAIAARIEAAKAEEKAEAEKMRLAIAEQRARMAGPDLLAALRDAVAFIGEYSKPAPDVDRIMARALLAIEKAENGDPDAS